MSTVRDALRQVERDGWQLVRTRERHRQYRHPEKPGTVTIAGKPGDGLPRGDVGRHPQARRVQGVRKPVQYTIVIERPPRNYAAYAPDLPGCIATGATREEVVREMRRAIAFHIESLREHGEPVPEPRCTAAVVDVTAVA